MDAVPLSAQEVLDTFFASAPAVRHPSMRGRAALTQSILEAHLEAHGESYFDEPESALLAAERQLEPRGAVMRTMTVRALIAALPSFLTRPWWPRDVRDASASVQTVAALRSWLIIKAPELADTPHLRHLDCALALAHSRLGKLRRATAHR